jgi:hypothetical protein
MEISANKYDLYLISDLSEKSTQSPEYSSKSQKIKTYNKKTYSKENLNLYKNKISAISSFFNVSNTAAKYMYHRRRKGFPYKKNDNLNFLPWTMQLQNALVKADTVTKWDWSNLSFHSDCETLKDHCIDINLQPITLYKNKFNPFINQSHTDEWTLVTSSKKKISHKLLLRQMGFLTKNNHMYIKVI